MYNFDMIILTAAVKDVIEKTEVVAIATYGQNGPHLVATWGDFIRSLDIKDGKTIIIPVGGYHQTERNLKDDNRIELLVGSKQAQGKNGSGTGYRLVGRAKIIASGKLAELAKSKFPWARGALVIEVEKVDQLL
jgi:hypothetical protein